METATPSNVPERRFTPARVLELEEALGLLISCAGHQLSCLVSRRPDCLCGMMAARRGASRLLTGYRAHQPVPPPDIPETTV